MAVATAAARVARADQAARQLPSPTLLVRPAIRQEAVSTSALEGTFAAFTDVLEADFLDEDELSSSVAEVRNYVRTAEAAFGWIRERPITIALLEHLQKMLVRGTRADTVKDLYNVSYQAANSAVGKMTELGMLRQRTEGRYARIFSCDSVLTLLESPT